ncbi:MAG: c-type cytochrome [Bacteroidetes bacterium]|nr:c-type cytochrome [Bacteroidota bacterium]
MKGKLLLLTAIVLSLYFQACQNTPPTENKTLGIVDKNLEGKIDQIVLPEGFEIEHLYSPEEHEQGSWVSITKDDKGRLIASDQYGVLYMIIPPAIGDSSAEIQVTPLPVEIGYANGLLWAFNSLYIVVNAWDGVNGKTSGLYRAWDSDDDDIIDQVELLKPLVGAGEHGPHAVLLSPDGNSLYVLAGNHTDLPEDYTAVQEAQWEEDQLFPYYVDPRGHANDRRAPGGWVAKVDPKGENWEIVSSGYRNPYDMGFNAKGDLFVFDADMEWDMGMPWYRPIRICHATSASAYGWRTGSGKFLAEYPDNLPPVVNIGQGSPTGVVMGKDLAFPAKYQKGLFAFDWSFGTMYFVNLEESGASYTGTKEEFLAGVPFPMADGVAGDDGAMYIVSGGRRLTSQLVRVSYQGSESTDPVPSNNTLSEMQQQRRELESLFSNNDNAGIETAWPYLNSEDRFLQYAARIVIENRPFNNWTDKLFSTKDPNTIIQGSIALARTAPDDLRVFALNALSAINAQDLSRMELISLLRAYSLIFIRMGEPGEEVKATINKQLEPLFPADDPAVDHILSQVLVYLDNETVVENAINELGKTETNADGTYISNNITGRSEQYGPQIEAMLKNLPPARDISLVMALSHADHGWTPALREKYFLWYYDALSKSGGESYKGFLDAMRQNAWDLVPDENRESLAVYAGYPASNAAAYTTNLPQPKGPGKVWIKSEIGNLMNDSDHKPDFENGEKMYRAVLCQACHVMKGEGGNIGPNLSQIGTRFSRWNMLDAIISPSLTVSDQYATQKITTKDGKVYIGRILKEENGVVEISSNPFAPEQTEKVNANEIASRENSALSPMPMGLLNALNAEEVIDLISYLEANGNADHQIYQ